MKSRITLALTSLSLGLSLTACGGTQSAAPTENEAGEAAEAAQSPAAAENAAENPAESADAEDSALAVPGYAVGEIPPIPQIAIPDISLLNSSNDSFTIEAGKTLTSIPGIKVTPAKCDGTSLISSSGTILNGDGSGVSTGKDGSKINNGDGSGVTNDKDATIINNGDGAGAYTGKKNGVNIVNNGDGTGTYNDKQLNVVVNTGGSGTSDDSTTGYKIVLNGDGSGTFHDEKNDVEIVNNGDGNGTYHGHGLEIINHGDGKALITSDAGATTTVDAEPMAKAPTAGSLPPMTAIKPIKSCGTTITLENEVLFDFDKSDLRPAATDTLQKVDQAFSELKAPAAEVYGHTDAKGDDDYNQKLSEDRAASVENKLKELGTTTKLSSKGFGETKPVAANENKDGSDNPSGRQLNRRVEIFVPAF
ncbi:OmpA family protein [Brevibacterium moorei]|uniref:OmpA family protein n=1 Tax=Brevibacterium moorei TaxID=2968457 RepID=UPI00211BE916|nr:OmpA family protein [Brevibacterium sp. 68QC2CO]MCQ9385502.1 OmpA family protein [Brevibacterium sp. 68QC2CO]